MVSVWLLTLASVTIISLVSIVGVLLIKAKIELGKKRLMYMVSFSVGGLFGGAFLHLLPESLEIHTAETVSLMVLTGILSSFLIEMLLKWRHCHIPTCDDHPPTFVYMNLLGDGVHNFIDGIVVGGAYLSSQGLGVATSLAIILHEIPQEIGDFGVLLYGGIEYRKALLFNLLSGLTALIGAFLALLLGEFVEGITGYLLPFALGNFVYIAGSDLVPELQDEKPLDETLIQFILMIVGITLLYLLKDA
jgi:zinc and cadmium transporter